MPTAKAKPPSAGTFNERPSAAITRKAPTVLMMMCAKMITVDQPLRRKTSSVTNVKTLPQNKLSLTRFMAE